MTDKPLSDAELLDLVQSQTLKYFWDFGHPVSGMARERSTGSYHYDPEHTVTTGGTGFGIMAMIAGAERGFIAKDDVAQRVEKIVSFLEKADQFHGAFSHFMDGRTGKVIPFSEKDDGGDLVETSFLMMGLLTARQYFKDTHPALAVRINTMWEKVEWDKYMRPDNNKLMWHWSPNHPWSDNNLGIMGWNECLITHVLAASSPIHGTGRKAYEASWLTGVEFKNGNTYHERELPLGPEKGGPLFFTHYSFLGLDPRGLKDEHADYWQQNRHHALINHAHCVENPGGFKGYGDECWGLTASDNHEGYNAHSPTNDHGVITPTAALSSFPYTPEESMKALRYFYGTLGNKIWGEYGFKDAFNESAGWVAKSYLAIDQGPIVGMIENYRSGLLWRLFMSCPEVKEGLKILEFETPYAPEISMMDGPDQAPV